MLDPAKLRADFPILTRRIHDKPLTYLDSAATAQKPSAMLEAMDHFYRNHYGSVRRGIYTLSEEATGMYEAARETVAEFIGADSSEEIVFTKNATEAINLVAYSWGRSNLRKGDAIVLTEMEHHANLIPWYILAKEKGLELRFAKVTDGGRLDMMDFEKKLKGAKLVCVTHVSNVLGTINPVAEITKLAHEAGAKVLVDGAQAAPNLPLDMCELEADWYVFSGHKLYGPTGIGVLRTHAPVYEAMQPFLSGGEMINEVGLGDVTFAEPPATFEAGTMPAAEAIGLAVAIDYLNKLGMDSVREHEQAVTEYALEKLSAIEGVKIYGSKKAEDRVGLVSFTVDGIHPHDLASLLDQDGVAIRSGHHCAQPLHQKLGVPATARASFSVFTTTDDIDRLATSIKAAQKTFSEPVKA
ncbi:cysteine desulfurase [Patescibacteria group bacterium]|nr:cysteine desulfurase [Patescibacteria group bacterium]